MSLGNSTEQAISSKDTTGPKIDALSPGYRDPKKPIFVWFNIIDDKSGVKNATLTYYVEQYANGSLVDMDRRVEFSIPMTNRGEILQAVIPPFEENTKLGLKSQHSIMQIILPIVTLILLQ